MNAVKIRAEHYHIEEVYTPFPVHGLDKAMGLEGTGYYILYVWRGGIDRSHTDDEFYHDWGLAPRYWWKAELQLLENMPYLSPSCLKWPYFAAHLMVITFYMRETLALQKGWESWPKNYRRSLFNGDWRRSWRFKGHDEGIGSNRSCRIKYSWTRASPLIWRIPYNSR